jgi:hypothetical protein
MMSRNLGRQVPRHPGKEYAVGSSPLESLALGRHCHFDHNGLAFDQLRMVTVRTAAEFWSQDGPPGISRQRSRKLDR